MLEIVPEIQMVGEADNGYDAVEGVLELRPDVILMDLVMPELDGIEAIQRIRNEWPEARVLVLTTFAGEDMIFPAIKAGATGYHLKDSSPEELIEAIRQVYQGESSLHPVVARRVLQELVRLPENAQASDQSAAPEPLTPREVEILRLIANGLDNHTISQKLVISEATVRSHMSHITDKLHLASRTQVALFAIREGYASFGNDTKRVDQQYDHS
jgi:NarL family two-component system response regulator LiaR